MARLVALLLLLGLALPAAAVPMRWDFETTALRSVRADPEGVIPDGLESGPAADITDRGYWRLDPAAAADADPDPFRGAFDFRGTEASIRHVVGGGLPSFEDAVAFDFSLTELRYRYDLDGTTSHLALRGEAPGGSIEILWAQENPLRDVVGEPSLLADASAAAPAGSPWEDGSGGSSVSLEWGGLRYVSFLGRYEEGVPVVPEPSAALLFGLGALATALRCRPPHRRG